MLLRKISLNNTRETKFSFYENAMKPMKIGWITIATIWIIFSLLLLSYSGVLNDLMSMPVNLVGVFIFFVYLPAVLIVVLVKRIENKDLEFMISTLQKKGVKYKTYSVPFFPDTVLGYEIMFPGAEKIYIRHWTFYDLRDALKELEIKFKKA